MISSSRFSSMVICVSNADRSIVSGYNRRLYAGEVSGRVDSWTPAFASRVMLSA